MRRFRTVLLALLVFSSIALPAYAGGNGAVTHGPASGNFFYWGDGYLALTGESLLAACTSDVPADGMFVSPGNGSFQEHIKADVPVMVFDFPDDDGTPDAGFAFLDENCPKAIEGDPSAATPIATGIVRLRAHNRVDTDGVVHAHNSLVGRVTTTGGDSAHLSTFAQVTFSDAAGLIELQQLVVRYGG